MNIEQREPPKEPGPLRKWWSLWWPSLSVGFGLAIVSAALCYTPWVERVELLTHDARFQLRKTRDTNVRIVLAEIADSTLQAWPEPTLFWGPRYAAAIDHARSYGARWVALDLIQAVSADDYLQASRWPGKLLPDQAFALSLNKGGVILSYAGPTRPIPALLYAHPDQMENLGFTDRRPESDDYVRHGAVYNLDGDQLHPSFPAAMAARLLGRSPTDPATLKWFSRRARPDALGGTIWINYVGPPRTFPYLPVERLAAGTLTAKEQALLRGATVIVGPTYSGSNDIHKGPGGTNYPGVEINANSVASLVDDRPLQRPPLHREAQLTLAFSLLAAAILLRAPFFRGLLIAAGATLVGGLASLRAYQSDILLPVVGPGIGIWMAWVGRICVRLGEEAARRRQVEEMFGPHVGKTVMRQLLADKRLTVLGGTRREMTVLFSDIRDFTPMSDRISAEDVVKQLNEYFALMSQCVLYYNGTLDKYLGDGLMAFWNSPVGQDDHPLRAVSAAWDMLQAVEWLNYGWRLGGRPELKIGIGINTGEVIVGCMGSDERKEFTVVGSGVNKAARIESANKDVGCQLLLGETTYERVREKGTFRAHTVRLKGFDAPVPVYEVVTFGTTNVPLQEKVASGH